MAMNLGTARSGSAPSGTARPDTGKMIMIPAATFLLVLDAAALSRGGGQLSGPRLISSVLTCAYYALIIWCYLRRGPAAATSRSLTAHAAAVLGTLAPLMIPVAASIVRPAGSIFAVNVIGRSPVAGIANRKSWPGRQPTTRPALIRGESGAFGVRM